MPRYLLHHQHAAHECGAVFAGFRGFASPLRRKATFATCHFGGHSIWWVAEAASETAALALLPFYVAERTAATLVAEVRIP